MAFPKHRLAVSVAVLNNKNEILLVKNWKRGWEFPGGYVENGESLHSAAIREVKEESGIEIQLSKMCGLIQDVNNSRCTVLFLGNPLSGTLTGGDDALDARYYSIEEALNKVTWKTYKERIIKCLNVDTHPFIIES
ncbi:NUDIX hydrolase [Peribacillus sp. V2I11]|jgi:8-oxo-dGTP diphosphatase|uniref:NUDIX hydrolase n=1 Tax=Peribacillus sp. V2I11 TaxID=3042277 RepID=UPI001BE8075E|nr:NUDIX hydrolase [Peribacillus sp. V2I11]MBT2601822.1 NUDIX hydrolase [Bacillus sp. ISL-53]MDQ0880946.1 8-oxo-dGTP diphosphatase [Peribacillus sp. V2I11]